MASLKLLTFWSVDIIDARGTKHKPCKILLSWVAKRARYLTNSSREHEGVHETDRNTNTFITISSVGIRTGNLRLCTRCFPAHRDWRRSGRAELHHAGSSR